MKKIQLIALGLSFLLLFSSCSTNTKIIKPVTKEDYLDLLYGYFECGDYYYCITADNYEQKNKSNGTLTVLIYSMRGYSENICEFLKHIKKGGINCAKYHCTNLYSGGISFIFLYRKYGGTSDSINNRSYYYLTNRPCFTLQKREVRFQ